MIRRTTWIVIMLFAVVLIFAVYWQTTAEQRQPVEPTSAFPTAVAQGLFNFDGSQLFRLEISDTGGRLVSIRRDAEGLWSLVEPAGEADLAAVESAVTQLTSLRITTALDPTADLSAYGLLSPHYEIILVLNGGERHTLLVGDVTPTNNGYYVRLDSNPAQVVNKFSLDPVLGLLDNPPLMPTAAPTFTAAPEITGTVTIEPTLVITTTVEP